MPKKPQRKIVGARLVALMEERGIKDLPLATAIGVSPSQIKRWKNNETGAMQDSVRALANFFGVSQAYLYGYDPKDLREEMALELERTVGEAEAEAVRALGALADEATRAVVVAKLVGWIEAVVATPLPGRRSPASMIRRGVDGAAHRLPADGAEPAHSAPGSHRSSKP